MRNRLFNLALVAAMATVLVFAGCKSGGQPKAAKENAGGPPPEAVTPMPALDGTNVSVDQYKGKVVLVNFWATWCQPCKIEIPWLIEFNQKYGPKGLVILGVAMDDEGKKVVEPFVQKQRFDVNGQSLPMDYSILLGSDKIADKFGGLIGLPTSVLYSRDGKKVKTIIGLINHDDLVKTLEKQL